MHPCTLLPGFLLVDGSLARFDTLASTNESKEQSMEKVRTGSRSWCTEWRKKYTLLEFTGVQIE